MMMRLSEAARVLGAQLHGDDIGFDAVSADTRTIRHGDLFIALKGERFDAHAFVGEAAGAGAAAVLVERVCDAPIPQLVVADTLAALAALGRYWRQRFEIPLIAITGSNGKTTVKEMLASILRAAAGNDAVLATRGNLNNHIGVPLMLLELRERHRYAAIEMGMNHPGEIAQLAAIAQPTVALVNNAQREHMEFMATVQAVAEENAAVFAALPADGVAVVNADDAHAGDFRRAAGTRRIVDFGLENPAAVSGGYVLKNLSSEIHLRTLVGEASATPAIPGLHNVCNALAACACAYAVGIAPAVMCEGLNNFRPYTGRLQVKRALNGATVIDDTYNANPDSVRAAIDVLAKCAPPTVLVLGDMGEVGDHGVEFHHEVGAYARSSNVSSLCAIGAQSGAAVTAFGAAATHAESIEQLLERVKAAATPQATLLIKGSRFMRMERVVNALTGETGGAH
jgi:UDP-N-acetylmuramoyl-tripeptide--D-alanyl-D-alanine ligase